MREQMKGCMSQELITFNRIYKELDDVYRDMANKLSLSESAFDILYGICEMGDGCLQRDICRTSCLPKQTVNSSIHKMEEQGYLLRVQGKGRSMHIHLTESGRKLMEEKIYPVIQCENEVMNSFSEEERKQFLELSERHVSLLKDQVTKL